MTISEGCLKETLRTQLAALTALDGVSGHEQAVVAYLRDALVPLVDEVQVDPMGNLYAVRNGSGTGPHLMLEAHSDEIGAMVKSIDPQGYLRILGVGGISPAMLVGRNVRVNGHHGVIGVKSGHLQSPEERSRVPQVSELYVDVGANSPDEVAALGIRIGDAVAYDSPLACFTGSDRVSGKAIDNRIGCTLLLQLARELAGTPVAGTVTMAICVQEEIGLRGAQVAAYRTRPDYAIAIDTFMSGDTPDVDYYTELSARIGAGPVLLLANSAHMGHPAVNQYVRDAARAAGVQLQESMVGQGMAATDAGAIHLSRAGVPTAGLSLARRYSHTPMCTLDLNDAAGALRILLALVRGMEGHTDLSFFAGAR
ncbi:MAG: M42 family metallopeptidase [Anaerolineae bacterium]|jgi:putative aminopeptidase FrvX|nr:M42 family metallopeptidase [Chloroflexota bacterium]